MRPFVTTVALVTLAGLVSGCCCPSDEQIAASRQKADKKRKAHIAKAEKYRDKMAKLSKAVPDAGSLEEKACDDKKIAKKIKAAKGFTGRLKRIDSAKLAWISQADPQGNSAKANTWNYLNSGFKDVSAINEIGDDNFRAEQAAKAVDKLKKDPYIAVIVREAGELPVVNNDDTFTVGYIDAWIVVMDTKKARPVCQVRFTAESSKEVEFGEGRIVSDEYKFKEAVKDDFEDNTDEAAKRSMKKITRKLNVSWGIF
jgi:hypothetical protein